MPPSGSPCPSSQRSQFCIRLSGPGRAFFSSVAQALRPAPRLVHAPAAIQAQLAEQLMRRPLLLFPAPGKRDDLGVRAAAIHGQWP